MAKASPMASRLYHTLPKDQKGREVFRALVGKVKRRLKAGWQEDKIQQWFLEMYFPLQNATRKRCRVPQTRSEVKATTKWGLSNLFVIFYCGRNPNRKQGEFLSLSPDKFKARCRQVFFPAGRPRSPSDEAEER